MTSRDNFSVLQIKNRLSRKKNPTVQVVLNISQQLDLPPIEIQIMYGEINPYIHDFYNLSRAQTSDDMIEEFLIMAKNLDMNLARNEKSIKILYSGVNEEKINQLAAINSMASMSQLQVLATKDLNAFNSNYYPEMISRFMIPKFKNSNVNEEIKTKNQNINKRISN